MIGNREFSPTPMMILILIVITMASQPQFKSILDTTFY